MSCSKQISQQAIGQEVTRRNWLGVGQQEQPIRRETGDPEPAHSLAAWDAQSVSLKFQGSHQVEVHFSVVLGRSRLWTFEMLFNSICWGISKMGLSWYLIIVSIQTISWSSNLNQVFYFVHCVLCLFWQINLQNLLWVSRKPVLKRDQAVESCQGFIGKHLCCRSALEQVSKSQTL